MKIHSQSIAQKESTPVNEVLETEQSALPNQETEATDN